MTGFRYPEPVFRIARCWGWTGILRTWRWQRPDGDTENLQMFRAGLGSSW